MSFYLWLMSLLTTVIKTFSQRSLSNSKVWFACNKLSTKSSSRAGPSTPTKAFIASPT
jgi:hypothetical protein